LNVITKGYAAIAPTAGNSKHHNTGYRPAIDGLRAIAVLGVVLYHLNPAWLPGGFAGVDVFFVISGYLISLIIFRELDSSIFSFSNFYVRRIRRLFPSLVLVVAATFVFGWFALFRDEFELLGRHITSAVTFVANFRLMGEAGYFDVNSSLKPLLHLWSLAIEEQFYFVWPLLIFIAHRARASRGIVIAICLGVSVTASMYLLLVSPTAHFFNPISRFWELLCGATLAYLRLYRPKFYERSAAAQITMGVVGIILILLSYGILSSQVLYPSGWALLPVMGTALILCASDGPVEKLLQTKILVGIGLISYPLYLWHWPIYSYLRISEYGTPNISLLLLGTALAFLLAWITFELIEKRIRYSRAHATTIALISCMVLLFVAGKSIKINDGYPDRSSLQPFAASQRQMVRTPRTDLECVKSFSPSPSPVYCRIEPGQHMLAVVGDSHAHVVFSGIAELRKQQNLGTLLIANSGCPPFDGAAFGRTPSEKKECIESIEVLLSKLTSDSSIEKILLVTRGPQYIDGTGFGPAEKNYNYPALMDSIGRDKSASQVFHDGLERTVRRLQAAGKSVYYQLQVPELGISPRDCFGRPFSFRHAPECAVSREGYLRRMSQYRSIVADVASATNIRVFDPESLMCIGTTCSMERNGILQYADDDHLSVAGSERLAPAIAAFLDAKGGSKTAVITP
jgi:peptidoglycan/LPS O-acetylase OafA/YrhL